MTRREHEFLILFNALWYRDFPITKDFLGFGTRAGWTLHIASTVREAANMMGLFMTFESGGRTDGEIHMFDENSQTERKTWAKVEWEWKLAIHEDVNEFHKLKQAADSGACQVAIFFGRYRPAHLEELLSKIEELWKQTEVPLLCFLLELNGSAVVSGSRGNRRVATFGSISTYRFALTRNNTISRTRPGRQPAYPWNVKGTKWAAFRSSEASPKKIEIEEEE